MILVLINTHRCQPHLRQTLLTVTHLHQPTAWPVPGADPTAFPGFSPTRPKERTLGTRLEPIQEPIIGFYQCLITHAHYDISRTVAAMDSCFALIAAHQHGITVRPMNGQSQ